MSLLRARLAEVQLAVMLLTRLPAGQIRVAPPIAAAAWAFPVAGGIVALFPAMTLLAAHAAHVPAGMAAGLALLVGVLATGGLHEDGLADCADGLGGGRDRLHKLEIMRDSRIGSYGGLALILALGMRWQALALIAPSPSLSIMALVSLAIASRSGLACALWLMPAARTNGMGQAASGTDALRAGIAVAIGLVALALAFGWAAGTIVIAMVVVQLGLAGLAQRQLGGQTGDVLGAMQQLAEIAGWIAIAALFA